MAYLYTDTGPKTDHPDSAIRLAAVVHRFRVPRSTRSVCFADSFYTVGHRHEKTRRHMLNADDCRKRLIEACTPSSSVSSKISSERVISEAKRYQPLINTILISCKVQPEQARLDEKLLFEWTSGIEQDATVGYQSEAIMYDLVMTIASEGLGYAAAATEKSVAGEFTAAAREYAKAAGVFHFLAEDQLPKWISKGSLVNEEFLPSECHANMAKALKTLFMANGQQMAVATLLLKQGTPNYSLLAKLCLGISKQLDNDFVATMRREAFVPMSRLDKDFLTLVTFQINVHKGLSLYFQSRAHWQNCEHGIAIALLSEATVALRTRETIASHGIPDVSKVTALRPLQADLQDLRDHVKVLLSSWEQDNNKVYFEGVPQHVPAEKKLQEGIHMNKMDPYALEPNVEPVLLLLPEGQAAVQRSDSDLARELQKRFNMGQD